MNEPKNLNLCHDRHFANEPYWKGGAMVGSQKYCYSLADMEVRSGKVVLRLADHSQYSFEPQDVEQLEACECGSLGVLPAAAIRIRHKVSSYPAEVAFFIFCDDVQVYIQRLKESGFCQN